MAVSVIYALQLIDVADEYRHLLIGSGNEIVLKSLGEIIIETHSVLEARKPVVMGIFKECLGFQCDAADQSCQGEFFRIDLRIEACIAVLVDQLQCTDEITVDIRYGEDKDRLGPVTRLAVDVPVEIGI